MKASELTPPMRAFLLSITTAGVAFVTMIPETTHHTTGIRWQLLLIPLAAGLVNGFGTLAFTKIISEKTDLGRLVFLVLSVQLLSTAVGSAWLFGEPFPQKKIIGAIIVAIGLKFLL